MRLSVLALPPTHFLTLHPLVPGTPDAEFSQMLSDLFRAIRRRLGYCEYLAVSEWVFGVRHAHALIRLDGDLSNRAARRAVKAAAGAVGLRCSMRRVRNPVGAVNYVFKHTRRLDKKAELTPLGYRGRMYTMSRGFLTKPLRELWREVKEELAARTGRDMAVTVAAPPAASMPPDTPVRGRGAGAAQVRFNGVEPAPHAGAAGE